MKQITLSTIAAGMLLFASCSKDDLNPTNPTNPTTPTTPSKKDLVIDGKWKWTNLQMVTNNNGQDVFTDAWSQVKDCDKDDTYTFTSDGKGVIEENANKCTDDPQTKNITWTINSAETEVMVTDDKGPSKLTVVDITKTTAVYRQRVFTGTDSITVQQTFTNVK
jgi:hypothetical protein